MIKKIRFIPCSEDAQTYYATKKKGKKKKGSYVSNSYTKKRT